uniref:Uncharacterized protein n=1 Tax=Avena sativa TaxID=4498 RepID=A0ACD5X6N8_AVESA
MSSSSRVAEIEVVVADGGARKGEEEQKKPSGAEPDPVVDVYSAAAYGDLERLRRFVEREGGAASLTAPAGNGYHALQWAALNNYPHVALYIIEHGGDGNADTIRLLLFMDANQVRQDKNGTLQWQYF